jgi:hypothetical protein
VIVRSSTLPEAVNPAGATLTPTPSTTVTVFTAPVAATLLTVCTASACTVRSPTEVLPCVPATDTVTIDLTLRPLPFIVPVACTPVSVKVTSVCSKLSP